MPVFLRSAEALGIHHHETNVPPPGLPESERIKRVLCFVEPMAILYRDHGVLVPMIFGLVPQLGARTEEAYVAARRLLDGVSRHGGDWFARAWLGGNLGPPDRLRRLRHIARRCMQARVAFSESRLGRRINASLLFKGVRDLIDMFFQEPQGTGRS